MAHGAVAHGSWSQPPVAHGSVAHGPWKRRTWPMEASQMAHGLVADVTIQNTPRRARASRRGDRASRRRDPPPPRQRRPPPGCLSRLSCAARPREAARNTPPFHEDAPNTPNTSKPRTPPPPSPPPLRMNAIDCTTNSWTSTEKGTFTVNTPAGSMFHVKKNSSCSRFKNWLFKNPIVRRAPSHGTVHFGPKQRPRNQISRKF